jgi:16S rRNA (cytosine967-C5)-methyltransferase
LYISQQIAAMAVSDVLAGRNLTLALPDSLSVFPNATSQQKGGGADLSYGTLRFYGEVNEYLIKLLEKPLSNKDIHALLLVAIYQLLYDKAESFTIVNQAVKAAGQAKPRWAKGLVNGVLRNFLRQKDALKTTIKQNEVALYSYPQWWIDKLKQQYANVWESILTVGNTHPPMTLRVNIRKSSLKEYMTYLARQDVGAILLGGEGVMLSNPLSVEKVPGFIDGIVSVQDYGAQLAAHFLDIKSNMRVLDACSAPGGKSGHLLELADINLTAIDNDANRLKRVEDNLNRLGLKANLQLGDAGQWQSKELFDRILADVPCSASGIVRRHVDIKWLRRPSDIVSFTQQQAKILANLWRLLSKGGKLLYVTCSIFAEENQQQIDHFLKQNADATQLPIDLTDDRIKEVNIQHGQLIPSKAHDGLFYALLQKS